MGPAILLDKSAFQKCPKRLLPELFRHYSLVVPRILVKEILEDHAEDPVKFLALTQRFEFSEILVNVNFLQLCKADLLGDSVPMHGHPCVAGKTFSSADGLFHVQSESADSKTLRRWGVGGISESEKQTASASHQASSNCNLEGLKAFMRKAADGIPKFSNDKQTAMREVAQLVDNRLTESDQQALLEWALEECNGEVRHRIRDRWNALHRPPLRDFAPYAHYCLKVKFIFYIALARGLVSSQHNSVLDLEYLYYLPFCQIFCSDDKGVHNVMQSVLMRPDQIFWNYGTFERALRETYFFFQSLTPDQMKKWLEKKGHFPPRGTFITRQMFKQFRNLPEDLQKNFAKKLPQELVESLLSKFKAARSQM